MKSKQVYNFIKNYLMTIVLVMLILFFAVSNEYFFTWKNFFNVCRQVAVLGVCGLGISFIMLSGAIDLSMGSLMTVLAIFVAKMMVEWGLSPVIAVPVTIACGTLFGFIIGFTINKLHIPAFIGTLAFSTVLGGVAYLLVGGQSVKGFPDGFKLIGQGYLGPIPVPVIILVLILLLGNFVLNHTVFGRYVYTVGGNAETARLSGLDPVKIKVICFSIAGALGAVAAIIAASRLNSVNSSVCSSYSFDAITANMLGGVSAKGGVGRISGILVGILIIGVLSNGMTLMNVQSYWQDVIKGIIMLFAIAMDSFIDRQGNKLAAKNG